MIDSWRRRCRSIYDLCSLAFGYRLDSYLCHTFVRKHSSAVSSSSLSAQTRFDDARGLLDADVKRLLATCPSSSIYILYIQSINRSSRSVACMYYVYVVLTCNVRTEHGRSTADLLL